MTRPTNNDGALYRDFSYGSQGMAQQMRLFLEDRRMDLCTFSYAEAGPSRVDSDS